MKKMLMVVVVLTLVPFGVAICQEGTADERPPLEDVPGELMPGDGIGSEFGPRGGPSDFKRFGRPGDSRGAGPRGKFGPGRGHRGPPSGGERGEWLKKNMPELDKKLEELKKNNSELFRRVVQKLRSEKFRKMLGAAQKKGDAQTLETVKGLMHSELDSVVIGDRYRKATTDTEKENLQAELRVVLEKSFSLKEGLQKKKMEGLKNRLEKLSAMIEKRSELKDRIIDQRMADVTGANDALKW